MLRPRGYNGLTNNRMLVILRTVQRLHHRPEWALYDRKVDPDELENLTESPGHKQTFQRLQKAAKNG